MLAHLAVSNVTNFFVTCFQPPGHFFLQTLHVQAFFKNISFKYGVLISVRGGGISSCCVFFIRKCLKTRNNFPIPQHIIDNFSYLHACVFIEIFSAVYK